MANASDTLISYAQNAWGAAACPPQTSDTVDGTSPSVVLRPSTVAMLVDMLRWADRDRATLVPRGSGTKIAWGPRVRRMDAVLSLTGLPPRIEHAAGDLVGIFPSGATLSTVNDTLAHENQWLPLDPLSGGASTIGGIVATNESGPRRFRYGAPRDLVIGVEMVLADGTLAKSGGRVVKNVSGYDLARMLCGSFGTLAVITSATFKLSPRSDASATITAPVASAAGLSQLALELAALPQMPSAIDFDGPPWRVMVRVESTATATHKHTDEMARLFSAQDLAPNVVVGAEEAVLWDASADAVRSTPGALLKVSVPPTSLAEVLAACDRRAGKEGISVRTTGRAALGVFFMRVADTGAGDSEGVASVIEEVRARAAHVQGFALLLEASPAIKNRVAAWGAPGSAGRLMQAVKNAFDPHGTLNPDRSFA
jgi:glycolate oxidase FAD binding subunit